MDQTSSIYRVPVLEQTPRLLGLLDRHPDSKTYGCFDRTFWHYKLVDFAGARLQEAVLTLALLYEEGVPPYRGNPLLKDWIKGALYFWRHLQASNGSFNEWYPGENSFVATAFSSYAVSEAFLRMKKEISWPEGIQALAKAGEWLLKHDEREALNQESGAAMALHNIFLVTGERRFREGADRKVAFLLKRQSEEGWFEEYGGADIGYLSLAVDYLAKYFQKTGDEKVLSSLKKAVQFLSHFLHPNGTAGGEYGSRNTEYLIPHGIEILVPHSPLAARVATFAREGILRRTLVGVTSLDDRYLCYNAYTYLQAAKDALPLSGDGGEKLPYEKESLHRYFSDAALLVHGDSEGYLVANLKKGGAFKWFSKKSPDVLYDAGMVVKEGARTLSSSVLSPHGYLKVEADGFSVAGNCFRRKNPLLSLWKLVILRFIGWLGTLRFPVGLPLKRLLRRLLIRNQRESSFRFERHLRFEEGGRLSILDRLEGDHVPSSVLIGEKFSDLYIPSARYFTPSELFSKAKEGIRREGEGRRHQWLRSFEKGRQADFPSHFSSPGPFPKAKTLYISYNGMGEPLLHSQVLPYLKGLRQEGYRPVLFTYEKRKGNFKLNKEEAGILRRSLYRQGIGWISCVYHKYPSLLATLYDVCVGFVRAVRQVQKEKIRLIHARGTVAALVAYGVSRLTGCRFLFDVRGLLAEEYADGGVWKKGGWLYRLVNRVERHLIRSSDGAVVLTEKAEALLIERNWIPLGEASRVVVIPCCVDLKHFEEANSVSQSHRFVLTYLGSVGTWYLLREMFEFFEVLKRVIPEAHFMILSPGDEREIRSQAGRLGLREKDVTVRKVLWTEVPRYLKQSHAGISFIKPSFSKQVSSPTKIGEYLASGLPVIANAEVGDIDCQLDGRRVGVLVRQFTPSEYRRGVGEVLSLLEEKEALAGRCKEVAQRFFSLEEGVRRYRDLYGRLLKERSSQ